MEPIEKAVAKALAAKKRAVSDLDAERAVDGQLADQQADQLLTADNARKMPDGPVAAIQPPSKATDRATEQSQVPLNDHIEGTQKIDSEKSTISEPGRDEADRTGEDTALPLGEQPAKPPLPVNSHHEPSQSPSADSEAEVAQGTAEETSAEALRRENARRQLFPNDLRGAPSNLPADGESDSQIAADGEVGQQLKDNSAAKSGAGVIQPAPNGSLAMLDPKKLDELVSKRLEGNLDGSVERKEEPTTDALNGLRMLDREFGNWERALRDGKKSEVLTSQTRANELLAQIPESMASELRPTVNMLNEQTQKLITPGTEKSNPEEETAKSKHTAAERDRKGKNRRRR